MLSSSSDFEVACSTSEGTECREPSLMLSVITVVGGASYPRFFLDVEEVSSWNSANPIGILAQSPVIRRVVDAFLVMV